MVRYVYELERVEISSENFQTLPKGFCIMSNISISNVEFTFSTSERFQELLNEGYSPKVVGIGVKLDSPLKPLSDAYMDVQIGRASCRERV